MRGSVQPSSLSELERAAAETADFFRDRMERLEVEIFTHADADGVASSLLLVSFLRHRDVPFHLRFTGPFGTRDMIRLAEAEEKKKLIVFLDQGGSEVDAIQKCLLETGHQAVVIDHHQGQPLAHPSLAYFNPHHLGVDGGMEISTAGLIYLVAEKLDRSLKRLAWLAIVGALGDRQEVDGHFVGANQQLVQRALEEGSLKRKEGLRLVGRSGSLFDALYYSIRPYLPGISGDEESCASILERLGVDRSTSVEQVEEKKALEAVLSSCPGVPKIRDVLWGSLYMARGYVHEEAAIAQVCGMAGRPELAFGRLAGDPHLSQQAWVEFLEYSKKILSTLQWLASHPDAVKTTPTMRYLHMPVSATVAGEILSLALESGILSPDLPAIGLVDSGPQIKVSGRVSHLAERKYNIGKALGMSARAVGGMGGGHEASGAAYIPKNKVEIFLSKLQEFLSDGGDSGEDRLAGGR
jgi:RecJ-like exonuclease